MLNFENNKKNQLILILVILLYLHVILALVKKKFCVRLESNLTYFFIV